MIWIVQDSLTWNALQNNCAPLLNVLEKMEKSYLLCGVIPFEHKITGVESLDPSLSMMLYGGTLLPILAKDLGWKNGIFWEDDWFDPDNWAQHRNDMLNQSVRTISLEELRTHWIQEPTFVKPVSVKEFTGMVLEGPDKEWFMKEYSALPNSLDVCCSPMQDIEREWRFWIVNGKIATGSLHKKYGYLTIREPIPEDVYAQANRMSKDWLLNPTIVMDIAQMRDGTYKVVEFNSINSSGFYNADIRKIVEALEESYDR
jgi:hypothetical protein